MIQVGDIFRTSYGSGPYRAVQILRGCTCPRYLDEIEMDDPPPSRPHIHIVCRCVAPRFDREANKDFYVNGYDETTLRSVWNDDCLEVIEHPAGVQLELQI